MSKQTITSVYGHYPHKAAAPYDKWEQQFGLVSYLRMLGFTHYLRADSTPKISEIPETGEMDDNFRLCFKPPVVAPTLAPLPTPRKVTVELTLPGGYELDGPSYLRPVQFGSVVYSSGGTRKLNPFHYRDAGDVAKGTVMIHLRPISPPPLSERRLFDSSVHDGGFQSKRWRLTPWITVKQIYGEANPLLPSGYNGVILGFTSDFPHETYLQVTGPNNPPSARPCAKTKTGVVRLILKPIGGWSK